MVPRLQYDIEGLGQNNGGIPKPDIPGYVTEEKCGAQLAVLEGKKLLWTGFGTVAGIALGSVLAVAVYSAMSR